MKTKLDLAFYARALPLYARNLGVTLPPLFAALIGVGLDYFSGWFFAPTAGAGYGIVAFVEWIILGSAFGISVIFADYAWRNGHADLSLSWEEARRKAGQILLAVIGFLFLIYIAQIVGSIISSILPVPYIGDVLGVLALWAFIYAIPAGSIGGIPGGAALSASLQAAKREPAGTAILVIVTIVVWFGLTGFALAAIMPYLTIWSLEVAGVLLKAIALGYIALIVAHQYSDLAFYRRW